MDAPPASPFDAAVEFLFLGGPAIWAIAGLTVLALALIFWKIWRLALIGAWSKGRAQDAVVAFAAGRADDARAIVEGRRGVRSRVVTHAMAARADS